MVSCKKSGVIKLKVKFRVSNIKIALMSRNLRLLVPCYLDCLNDTFLTALINPLTPNDHYSGRTAPLTSKRCILYIYSTNIGTEYFKHGIYSQFFPSSKCSLFHNSNVFGSCIIHILYTGCAKIKKKKYSGAKRLMGRLLGNMWRNYNEWRVFDIQKTVHRDIILVIANEMHYSSTLFW